MSRDVVFYESIFPFSLQNQSICNYPSLVLPVVLEDTMTQMLPNSVSQWNASADENEHIVPHSSSTRKTDFAHSDCNPVLRGSTRGRKKPGYLEEYHHKLSLALKKPSFSMLCNRSAYSSSSLVNVSSFTSFSHVKHSIDPHIAYKRLSNSYKAFVISMESHLEPQS